MKKSHIALAGAALAGAGGLAYARYVERLWIDVRSLTVTVASPGLPPAGLRILHLSDMHFTGRGAMERWKIERTVKLLAGESVDLLLVTGDFIHDDGGLDAALELIRRLPRPRLGTFACLGNHDYACYSWLGPARTAWSRHSACAANAAAVSSHNTSSPRPMILCIRCILCLTNTPPTMVESAVNRTRQDCRALYYSQKISGQ